MVAGNVGCVGVLAIQGDFDKHLTVLSGIGASGTEVRTVADLQTVDRLIIPGGESTTVGLLMRRSGLDAAIRQRAASGMPIWGTCMGMILMASHVKHRPDQICLGLMDIEIERNAFGSQVHSFEDEVHFPQWSQSVLGVFIRAPIVTRCGPGVTVLARYRSEVVAVSQGACWGTSFHPELTEDASLHHRFVQLEAGRGPSNRSLP